MRPRIDVEVTRNHFPDVEIEGDAKARLEDVVDVGTRCNHNLLRLEGHALGFVANGVHLPDAAITLRRANLLDTCVLLSLGTVVLGQTQQRPQKELNIDHAVVGCIETDPFGGQVLEGIPLLNLLGADCGTTVSLGVRALRVRVSAVLFSYISCKAYQAGQDWEPALIGSLRSCTSQLWGRRVNNVDGTIRTLRAVATEVLVSEIEQPAHPAQRRAGIPLQVIPKIHCRFRKVGHEIFGVPARERW